MTNPTPRPALRKAADAGIHPAAPRPARSPRARTVAPTAIPEPAAAPETEPITVEPVAVEPVAVEPVATTAAPLKPPKKRHPEAAKPPRSTRRKFSGSTSDSLRVPEVPEVTSSQRSALDHLFENDAVATRPKAKAAKDETQKPKQPKASKPVDLMSGKLVELEAKVPKALRKAARDEAMKRGLDVDTVVTDLLHAWLTERP
jgi:hypothetical protein